jgi:hypothetical protein
VFRILIKMPQLDTLTYFSQFVYLCISFVLGYIFILNRVIPKMISVQKLRGKLNSLALLTWKLNGSNTDINTTLHLAEANLVSTCWNNRSKLKKMWAISARMEQLSQVYESKKVECYPIVHTHRL